MGVVVQFNFAQWQTRYPEFSSVSSDLASAYFNEATLYLANDGSGPVNDVNVQSTLLNMLVAHLAQLYATTTTGGITAAASALVGRISSASEGSVSVSTDLGAVPGSAAWYAQSKYGFSFWQATAPYRTMRYVPRRHYGGLAYLYGGGYR